MRKNILVINLKGGAAKSTNSSLLASHLIGPNGELPLLLEIDKINETANHINPNGYYEFEQIDFLNESTPEFLEFEVKLIQDGIKIVDVGAVKLDVFNTAMIVSQMYDLFDLIVIPAMDGELDFIVAMDFLNMISGKIESSKIVFSFNRFNKHEYSLPSQQFDSFFSNAKKIKKSFGVELEGNYYTIADSKAVKNSVKKGVTVRELYNKDLAAITAKQRAAGLTNEERLKITEERSLVTSAQLFWQNSIEDMMSLVTKKLEM